MLAKNNAKRLGKTKRFTRIPKDIEEITSAILIGIPLVQHLKWDKQINIYNIINCRLYLLKRIRSYINLQCRIQFYYALMYPQLLYCITLWGQCQQRTNNVLTKITEFLSSQQRCLQLYFSVNSTGCLSSILIKIRKILMVFNTLKTSWPSDLRKLFVFLTSHPISQLSPNFNKILYLRFKSPFSYRTEQTKSKISYCGGSLFNSLLSELKDIENHSIHSYKKNLKTYFL